MKLILIWLILGLALCIVASPAVVGKKEGKHNAKTRTKLLGNEEGDEEYVEEDEDEDNGPPIVTCGPSYTLMFSNMDCWKQCKQLGGTPSNCKFTTTSTTCICVGLPVLGAGSITPKGLMNFFTGHLNGTYQSTMNFFQKGTGKAVVTDKDDDEYDEEEEQENEELMKAANSRRQRS